MLICNTTEVEHACTPLLWHSSTHRDTSLQYIHQTHKNYQNSKAFIRLTCDLRNQVLRDTSFHCRIVCHGNGPVESAHRRHVGERTRCFKCCAHGVGTRWCWWEVGGAAEPHRSGPFVAGVHEEVLVVLVELHSIRARPASALARVGEIPEIFTPHTKKQIKIKNKRKQ